MGYDFSMHVKAGSDEEFNIFDGVYITYNLGKMITHAFNDHDALKKFDRKTGAEILPIIENSLPAFKINRDLYESWNPSNGWGSRKGLLKALVIIRWWCKRAPDATMHVWY